MQALGVGVTIGYDSGMQRWQVAALIAAQNLEIRRGPTNISDMSYLRLI